MSKLSYLFIALSIYIAIVPLTTAKAGTDGMVELRFERNALIAELDLKQYDASVPQKKRRTAPMLLSLYDSQTWFSAAEKCHEFDNFACSQNECEEVKPVKEITLNEPFYGGSDGRYAKVTAILDYKYFRLSKDYNSVLVEKCFAAYKSDHTYKNLGVLALGIDGDAKKNFDPSVERFLVKVDQKNRKGYIQFNPHEKPNEFGQDQIRIAFPATDDWRLSNLTNLRVLNKDFKMKLNVMFDTNIDSIGLPLVYYKRLITMFSKKGIRCQTPNKKQSKAFCEYHGKIRDLPTITLAIGGQILPLYPQLYVDRGLEREDHTVQNFTLNLKGLNPNRQRLDAHNHHGHVGEADKQGQKDVIDMATARIINNNLILGNSFLNYYNVVFDIKNKQVVVTGKRYAMEDYRQSAQTIVHGFAIAALILGVLYGGYLAYQKIKARQLEQNLGKALRHEDSQNLSHQASVDNNNNESYTEIVMKKD